jgi:uncharacterized membrane protein YeaQ/YmgE (transglycosylase-associated protein family)
MEIINLIISLVSGAVGGNVAGYGITEKNMGPIANSIIGLIGGGAGDFILRVLGVLASTGTAEPNLDLSTILANIGVSGVSGAALTAIVSLIKDAIQKK